MKEKISRGLSRRNSLRLVTKEKLEFSDKINHIARVKKVEEDLNGKLLFLILGVKAGQTVKAHINHFCERKMMYAAIANSEAMDQFY